MPLNKETKPNQKFTHRFQYSDTILIYHFLIQQFTKLESSTSYAKG